jgi:predicted nucleotidyltransferase
MLIIVPFGSVAIKDKRISWPPEHEIVMSVVGFEEAYRSSMLIRLSSDPALEIRLPTLPGLALMKIISWEDRYPERKKDAEDLLFIMNNYEQAGNFDRLYDHEQELLKEENFDTQLAGIRLLGRDMAIIADHSTTKMVRNILDAETGHKSQYRLITNMIQNTIMFENKFDEILLRIKKLIRGFAET